MKSRKLTGLLLVLTIILWAIVVRRVISYTATENQPEESVREPVARESAGRDYTLSLDYRDPFGDSPTARKVPAGAASRKENPVEPEPLPEPPPISFRGVIRQGKRDYAILEIEARSGIFLRGDTLAGCRVISIAADSVILQNGKHRYIIKHR